MYINECNNYHLMICQHFISKQTNFFGLELIKSNSNFFGLEFI